ncbi:hypothetical protein LINGRAPRIM_LOCUS3414 [Linum grandiflorum]
MLGLRDSLWLGHCQLWRGKELEKDGKGLCMHWKLSMIKEVLWRR